MNKVKIFRSTDKDELEDDINEFLSWWIVPTDIKFSIANCGWSYIEYSAMVIYSVL